MTNFEKIKNMSFDEMADFLGFFNVEEQICRLVNPSMGDSFCRLHECSNCAKVYLESEAE